MRRGERSPLFFVYNCPVLQYNQAIQTKAYYGDEVMSTTVIVMSMLCVFCLRLLWDICKLENRVKALEMK